MNILVSELICTRLSHDLIGNIGAVANAVELLEEGDMDFMDDIKSILQVSSGVLSARLKFFRMAFGLAGAGIEDMEQVQKTTAAYLATIGGKNPPVLEFGLAEARHGRAVMLAVMALADLLIKGGTVRIGAEGGTTVVAVAADARVSAEKQAQALAVLKGSATEVSAQDAPLLYLQEICRAKGLKLSCGDTPSMHLILE